jgi:acyl-CoA synthetase (NDP forming)
MPDVTGRPTQLRDVDLGRFFRPRSVAVIGASDTDRRPNTAMWRKLRAWGEAFGATVIPVNPNRDTLDGLTCYKSIGDVPGDIDLAAVLVGDAVTALAEVIDRKVGFAVVFAAGFNEVGAEGEALQARMEELIRAGDTHVLGPNTNLNAFEVYNDALPGRRLALITQSGHQGRPIYQSHEELGIAMSHWAPVGNEADLEFADFVKFFADQDDIGVIAAYIEGFKDGRTLQLAADHAARQGVPIVIVKVGRTDEGQSMAKAHTGHLTGADDVVSAVFRQYGVTRVDGLDELVETGALLSRAPEPGRAKRADGVADGVCIYAISGGTGAHMADLAADIGLRLPELTAKTQKDLHQWIPTYLRVSNPVDNGGPPSGDERGRKILDAIVADKNVDLIICPITGALPSMANQLTEDLAAVAETTDKPICVIWGSPTYDAVAYKTLRASSKLVIFHSFGNCVRAVKAYLDYHAFQQRYASPFAKPVTRPLPAAKAARALITPAASLSEHDSKRLLAAYGIPVTNERLVTKRGQAAKAAEAVGYPVVLKVSSPTILHKSDLGLVRVGLTSEKQVKAAFDELMDAAGAEGVLVSEMVTGGVETVVGVAQDDLFGPTVMFGLGGVFVEVLEDVTFRVPPFDRAEAMRMVQEVKGFPLLTGARGRPKADVKALVDVILKVQRLALDLSGELAELDINPLVVLPKGAVALDALAVCT